MISFLFDRPDISVTGLIEAFEFSEKTSIGVSDADIRLNYKSF
jgi:hypothetical protein